MSGLIFGVTESQLAYKIASASRWDTVTEAALSRPGSAAVIDSVVGLSKADAS